ncbi:hypothetical protein FHX34_106341 [Actinoplanes teichomyceticus]|uniref:Uncharacterized protein n=1 Tax=Actinoplanes teichomyceticus TaxID=1867 RepID=A0A561VJ03_ACTTI|nr:hypothetical protein FHX34_106341 [Actinoplanes teichomyceticus]
MTVRRVGVGRCVSRGAWAAVRESQCVDGGAWAAVPA